MDSSDFIDWFNAGDNNHNLMIIAGYAVDRNNSKDNIELLQSLSIKHVYITSQYTNAYWLQSKIKDCGYYLINKSALLNKNFINIIGKWLFFKWANQ